MIMESVKKLGKYLSPEGRPSLGEWSKKDATVQCMTAKLKPRLKYPSTSNTHFFSAASGGVRYDKTLETENKNVVWNDNLNYSLEDQIICDQRLEPVHEELNRCP